MKRADMAVAIGARVRARRHELGMTQHVLAERIGTYREIVKRVELGRHLPDLEVLRFYAVALGVRLSELVSAADEVSRESL
jgi:transcriptional regulator with XRE-family HTH domain